MVEIRKHIALSPEQALFIYVGDKFTIPQQCKYCIVVNEVWVLTNFIATLMGHLYETHKDADGLLYVSYNGENAYGGGHKSLFIS